MSFRTGMRIRVKDDCILAGKIGTILWVDSSDVSDRRVGVECDTGQRLWFRPNELSPLWYDAEQV